jgi:hypothetical protein
MLLQLFNVGTEQNSIIICRGNENFINHLQQIICIFVWVFYFLQSRRSKMHAKLLYGMDRQPTEPKGCVKHIEPQHEKIWNVMV